MEVQEWLHNNEMGIDIWKKKYRYNNESFEQFLDRVSMGNKDLRQLIKERKFIFGGRVLSNIGITPSRGSLFNCYSAGYCPDDMEGILDLNKVIGLTYKAQGGQGVSLSKLRPKGTMVGEHYQSDGIVPFLKLFNQTTESISQGGSRKGALMVSLDIRHKEAETFMNIKADTNDITKANLSMEIDDAFMGVVEDYYDNGHEHYNQESVNYNGHLVDYTIKPIKLFKTLARNAHQHGEPGVIFTNKFRYHNLMEYVPYYEIETCNPCGEQPLPKHGCCNLGSINLDEFVLNPFTEDAKVDIEGLVRTIHIAVEALDNLIDINADNHVIPEQRENSLKYRNIGLGVMGFANMLMKVGYRYGSEKACIFADSLFHLIFQEAFDASKKLAAEKGRFPGFHPNINISNIVKDNFDNDEYLIDVLKTGIRNCSLISIAPTGSISSMLGVAGGIEPEFALRYERTTESLNNGEKKNYVVLCKTLEEYYQSDYYDKTKDIPCCFVTAKDIPWNERINMQSDIQKHVDTAISSTINLPNDISVDDVERLYVYAWQKGLKGVTIFREGCDREAILNEKVNFNNEAKTEITTKPYFNYITPVSRKTMGTTHGNTYHKKCACGTLYITINEDDNHNLVETFVATSKTGVCSANIGAINRLISVALRSGVKVDEIIDQLQGIRCAACLKSDKEVSGISCPDIVARCIKEFISDKKQPTEVKEITNPCPSCGEQLTKTGGCVSCLNCGWSKC